MQPSPSVRDKLKIHMKATYDVLINEIPRKEHEDRITYRVRQAMTGVAVPRSDIKVRIEGKTYILTFKKQIHSDAAVYDPSGIGVRRSDGPLKYGPTNSFYIDRHRLGNKGRPKYHFNVKHDFKKLTRITDHQAGRTANVVGKGIKAVKKTGRVLGKAAFIYSIIMDSAELAIAISQDITENKVSNAPTTAARIAGRWGGAILGAKALGALGAAAGTAVSPGLGTIVVGGLGSVVGGIIGGIFGEEAVNVMIEAVDGVGKLVRLVGTIVDKGIRLRRAQRIAATPSQVFETWVRYKGVLRTSIPGR